MRKICIIYALALLAIFGCGVEKSSPTSATDNMDINASNTPGMVEAFPGLTGPADSGYYLGNRIYFNRINGKNVFQGDIILDDSQISSTPNLAKGASAIRRGQLWPNSTVFYTIDQNLRNQARVTSAISHWQTYTSMTFVLRTNQANFIRFQQDPANAGCWGNSIGMRNDGIQQGIWLADWGTTGTVIHEIGHAVNLFHEHARLDGDNNNIRIVWTNISHTADDDWWPQFVMYNTQYTDGVDHGAYDFNSIMHYPCFVNRPCAINPNQAIITKINGSTWTTNSSSLSTGDVAGIDANYPLDLNITILAVGTDKYLWRRATLNDTWRRIGRSNDVQDVSVMRNGTLLGVGYNDNALWTKATANSPWVSVPNSGSVTHTTILPNGSILGVGKNDRGLWTRATLNSPWVSVPNSGNVVDVTVLPNGTLLGVGTDYFLWTRATLTSPWVRVANSGSVISVTVMQNGSLLGVGLNNSLWTRATLNSTWVSVPNSSSVMNVSRGIGR